MSSLNKEPSIGVTCPGEEWCKYVGDEKECEDTYFHITRSGFFSLEKEQKLLGYYPRYTNVETIRIAVRSYIERGLIRLS